MFTLKQIDGAVVEKMTYPQPIYGPRGELAHSYNQGIDAQSSVRLKFNRDRIKEILADTEILKDSQGIIKSGGDWTDVYADAIIAADRDIIEVER